MTIVAKGESQKVEFKATTGQRTDGAKTVCALANGLGGYVLFGVTDKGGIVGQRVSAYGKTKRLQSLYPQCSIRLARFRGKNRLADFVDNRQYWGHAFALLRRAETFLLDHVPIAGRVVPGKMVHEDRPLYPPLATREAIANALCHRDYANAGRAVSVAMYDGHLERPVKIAVERFLLRVTTSCGQFNPLTQPPNDKSRLHDASLIVDVQDHSRQDVEKVLHAMDVSPAGVLSQLASVMALDKIPTHSLPAHVPGQHGEIRGRVDGCELGCGSAAQLRDGLG